MTCKSTRGTGTRDQDKVTVEAHYDDESEAYDKTDIRKNIIRRQIVEQRKMDDEGMNTR